MHCNLRPPDVALVVLDFNYEAHYAPVYTPATSFGLGDPDFLLGVDILATFTSILAIYYCACAEAAISELL